MQIDPDEYGGETVTLFASDDIDAVPESHRDLVTPAVREVFADPLGYFQEVATRAKQPFPNMAKWLRTLLRKKLWMLQLEVGSHPSLKQAGYYLFPPDNVRSALLGVTVPFDPTYPKGLAAFYSLVGFVDWNGVNMAGKLDKPDTVMSAKSTLSALYSVDSPVDAASTRIIGGSLCGDMMVCTADGQGGWWNHETGAVDLKGPIIDFIDWVFGELLADRTPESDGVFRKKKRGWF